VDYPADRREVLVVDNGSTDATSRILDGFPVRRVGEPRRGAAHARNAGILATRGEIVAFTDADCVVTRGWLRAIVDAFETESVGGVAGEIAGYPPETPAERYASRIRHLSPQRYLSRPVLPFAVFANLAFRRDVFDRIGLLDPALAHGESTDFCTRFLRGSGLELRYAPRAVVLHRHRRTAGEFFRQQWNYGRGHALLSIKYRDEAAWGWRQSAAAYRELARAAARLGAAGLRRGCRSQGEEFELRYFDFLTRLAERLGSAREALAHGYLHL
jgi:GT2 family glycosyltransferase